jgi:outer membrane biosynthesis protein TonB
MTSALVLRNESGSLLKVLSNPPSGSGESRLEFGLHRMLGWVSQQASMERLKLQSRSGRARARRALDDDSQWLCRFELKNDGKGSTLSSLDSCRVFPKADGLWNIHTPVGTLEVASASGPSTFSQVVLPAAEQNDRTLEKGLAVAVLLAMLFFTAGRLLSSSAPQVAEVPIIEPVTVKILPEKQKPVRIVNPVSENALPKAVQNVNAQAKRAIQQNLGFLGMLGSKNLSKALGGATTALNASAGAGKGGKEGSGGELLVGLGQGVKRTTVGNSGVAGLGGIGTKGAGGGNGGYGNSMVGSGEGRALSAMAVSNDLVLEGGLDRAVIQATIAKYLSQVRACYEQGLASSPGINGTVTMNFQVGPAGNLDFSKVGKSTLGHAGVENCISQRMMGWKFPKPLGGVAVKVNYPFLLRPVGG